MKPDGASHILSPYINSKLIKSTKNSIILSSQQIQIHCLRKSKILSEYILNTENCHKNVFKNQWKRKVILKHEIQTLNYEVLFNWF